MWLAYDEHLDSPVAIKVLADNWTEDFHVRQRFVEEGRFLRKVESPHVVSVYDAGELADGRPFLVMSYADQGTLADRLELAPLTTAQALHVITQVGAGLTALHDRGVLHRDVKPANVLFRNVEHGSGTQVLAMLGDLGLGKAMDMSSRLTMIGGTPTYAAPEQARGEALDPRADQYSLAALAYYLLAGRPAHDHTTLSAAADPKPPAPMGEDVPPEAEAAVLRGLSPDRDGRFPSVEAFVQALVEAMGECEGTAPEAWIPVDPELTQAAPRPELTSPPHELPAVRQPPARPTHRGRWVLAGVLAVVLGVGGGAIVERVVSTERTLDDSSGTISVTVPEEWTQQVDPDAWTPPDSEIDFASLAAGQRQGWQEATDPAPGVFVGLLPGTRLPETVPQHPECTTSRPPVEDLQDGDESVTVVFSGCTGTDVTVERVVRTTANQLLWIQVRSDSRATANRVLDSVTLHGM